LNRAISSNNEEEQRMDGDGRSSDSGQGHNRSKIVTNMQVIQILVAAAVLPCHAGEAQDPAKAGGGLADVGKQVLALTGSRTKIVWVRRVAGMIKPEALQPLSTRRSGP
jgi:hypothetical protein